MPTENKMLERVRALLAQAEHPTTSEAEAEVFTAKALGLMAKYGIDRLQVDASAPGSTRVKVAIVRCTNPMAGPKRFLLCEVAQAMGARVTITKVTGPTRLYGYPSDLERIEMIYTSLLLQASTAMARQVTPVGMNTRTFRHGFITGFALRVGERIAAAEAAAAGAAGTGTDLVLSDRARAVDEAVEAAHPNLKAGRSTRVDPWAAALGAHEGNRANIGADTNLGRATTASLT